MSLSFQLRTAVGCLKQGQLITYPTETLYGLGCDASNRQAVNALLQLKQRSMQKGLIVIASKGEQIDALMQSDQWRQFAPAEPSHPPTTWLLKAGKNTPYWLTGQHNTLAVRFTSNTSARKLCDALNAAIVSTSANLAGRPPAMNALKARRYFGKKICCYLPGGAAKSASASRIIDSRSGHIIRE